MLRLIRKDETIEVPAAGTTFVVSLQSHAQARALKLKHTSRGRVDDAAMAAEFFQTHIKGWRDLADCDGAPIPFDPKLVLMVVDALPDDVITLLAVRIREPQVAVKAALGNGEPSSSNAS